MRQGITNVGSIPSAMRQCARCIRAHSRRTPIDNRANTLNVRRDRPYSTTPTTERRSVSADDTLATVPTAGSTIDRSESEAGPSSKAALTNVWSRIQGSPKRQCILTRKTLPSDYLLKLKPRYYPPTPTQKGGTYLTPSLVNSDPGRSHYLTAHKEVISRINEPGPHLGVLAQNGILISRKLDDWIQSQLVERLIKELRKLVTVLGVGTPKFKNTPPLGSQGELEKGVIERYTKTTCLSEDEVDRLLVHLPSSDQAIPRRLEAPSASEIDLRSFPLASQSALFDCISQLLAIDRKFKFRQALSNKADFSQPHLRHLIGKHTEGVEGTTVSISSASVRGQLALPTMVALLRLKLYSGEGWSSQ